MLGRLPLPILSSPHRNHATEMYIWAKPLFKTPLFTYPEHIINYSFIHSLVTNNVNLSGLNFELHQFLRLRVFDLRGYLLKAPPSVFSIRNGFWKKRFVTMFFFNQNCTVQSANVHFNPYYFEIRNVLKINCLHK